MTHASRLLVASLALPVLLVPTVAQAGAPTMRPNDNPAPHAMPFNPVPSTVIRHASVESLTRGEGPADNFTLALSDIENDRASMNVRIGPGGDFVALGMQIDQAMSAAASAGGYDGFEVVDKMCRAKRSGSYTVSCNLKVRFQS